MTNARAIFQPRKPLKYRNRPMVVNGIQFGSIKEANRWTVLTWMQQQGQISNLEAHPVFSLDVNEQHICDYIADSRYCQDGRWIVEDVKSPVTKTATYRLKKKLMWAIHKICVQEV